MLRCYNRRCGLNYDPELNDENSCRHHPGKPIFHDAYKGWSCCKKKTVDFTEFLNIEGCTLSKHSNVKPPEPEKPINDNKDEVVVVRAPITGFGKRPPADTAMTVIKPTVQPIVKEAIDNLVIIPQALNDGLNSAKIATGTSCKNSGCTYKYVDNSLEDEKCQYHLGVPIFHEGMKYWSCCKIKTSDFSVFMAQKGCVFGEHLYHKSNVDTNMVNCRYDWHQTSTDIIFSIYAKKYHYADSVIEVNPVRLHCILVFPEQNNAKFEIDLELKGIIKVESTKVIMYRTKVEITMPKAEPCNWSKLDFPREKFQPPIKDEQKPVGKKAEKESDDTFNLDDIQTVNAGIQLVELDSQDEVDYENEVD